MIATRPEIKYSWDFLQSFDIGAVPSADDWQSIMRLSDKAEEAIKPHISELKKLEVLWAKRLAPVCGHQVNINWSKFRPLRLSREEDWSDWLAWLLENSQTGVFAYSLFADRMKRPIELFVLPNVEREVSLEGRRADVVVEWQSNCMSHVEVKIWDENFDKTFETSQRLRSTAPDREWTDFILIPNQSQAAWNEIAQEHSEGDMCQVSIILWDDVARALRRCLWEGRESAFWRAWAWAFCRVIEHEVLGLRKLEGNCGASKIPMILLWLSVLNVNPEGGHE